MAERVGIIGAGLAGLSCAYYLEKQGYTPLLFERASTPGGRVSTEHYEGYLLDKGLQILLTSYKEVSDIVRFYELGLGRFHSGVDVYYQGSWHPFYNPLKHPLSVFKNRKIPFVTFSDTVKLGSLYFKNVLKSQVPVFQVGRPTLRAFLAENEISPAFVEAVIRPFFGGVSLDPDIQISDELFLWLLHFFIEGVGVLPKAGMQALPKAIAGKLSKTVFHYDTTVTAVHGQTIYLEGGGEVFCDKIVLATSASQARNMISSLPPLEMRSMTGLYFAADKASFTELPQPLIYLNGMGEGPINHLAFVSIVQPSYAPADKVLVSATVLKSEWQHVPNLVDEVKKQLTNWFGGTTARWKHLKSYFIEEALPVQDVPPPLQRSYQIDRHPDIYLCGEYVDHSSINGALASGRHTAEAIHEGIQRMRNLDKSE